MKDFEEHTVDKTDWEPGPWQTEPDKKQWTDAETGLPCLIVRNRMGALCGYVGVPNGHPWYEVDDEAVRLPGGEWPEIHGGLTYSAKCQSDGLICHKVEPGEPDDVWWLGFDCAHSGDKTDMRREHSMFISSSYEAYRDFGYVERQCKKLAAQAMQAATSSPEPE